MQSNKTHSKLFRKRILKMSPYSPPLEERLDKNYLRLDFNERTIPPHKRVLKEIEKYIKDGVLQAYPEYEGLNEVLANYIGVHTKKIIPTVGSDQGIDLIMRAIVNPKDKVIIPTPTFAMLNQSALIQDAVLITPYYEGPDYAFPFTQVIKAIKPGVKLVVICKPNNPTGTPIQREESEAIVQKALKVGAGVLSDEAYHEYAPEFTVVDLVDKYPNLFVTRTFSKTMGIPSLRAGLVVSQEQNIAELRKIRGPYDVNMIAVTALKTLRHPEVRKDIKKYTDEVRKVSKPMVEAFYKRHRIKFAPSVANFHLLEVPGLYEFMKTKSILIRPRTDPPDTQRVSIGTEKDTGLYLKAFREFLKKDG